VLEISDKVVVCVNLMDEARRKGLAVDTRSLARDLGVPAVPTSASAGEGVRELIQTVADVIEGKTVTAPHRMRDDGESAWPRAIAELLPLLETVAPGLPNARWVAMRLLDGDLRVRQALESGELLNIVSRQREAITRFSRKMALEGTQ
jgi:ferrous iron transport protein B